MEGKPSVLIDRNPTSEVEILAELISRLVTSPHVLLLDAAENLPRESWQLLAVLIMKRPPICLILATRDLHTWTDPEVSTCFDTLILPAAGSLSRSLGGSCRVCPIVSITSIELLPLTKQMAGTLLSASLAQSTLPVAAVDLLHAHCGGNPAFLLAMAAQLPHATHRWLAFTEESIRPKLQHPPSVMKELVLAHLDRVPLEQQMVLKIASALGVSFDREVLNEVYPGTSSDLDQILQTSGLGTYLKPDDDEVDYSATHLRYVFHSAGTREIVYSLMLLAQRKRLHAQTAEWYRRLYALRPSAECAQPHPNASPATAALTRVF